MLNDLDLEDDLNDDLPEEQIGDEVDLNDDDLADDNEEPNPAPKGTALTPEQIADLAAQTALRVQPQSQPKQMTPEEIDAKLHRYKVNPEIIKLLRDPEAAPEKIVEALQGLVDGAAKHAIATSQLLFQNDLSPLQQKIQANEAFVQEQQTRTFVKNVSSQYPSLAKYENVVRQATQMVAQSGYVPKSHSDARRQVALQAQQIIRSIDPQFSIKSNPARQAGGFGPRRSSHGGGQSAQASTGAASFKDYLR